MGKEDTKAKIFATNVVSCSGVLSYRGHGLTAPVDALIITRVDGTADVACPFYRGHNEGVYIDRDASDKGTCAASEQGNKDCIYRKLKPDTVKE